MEIKNIAVFSEGDLATRIAFRAAFYGMRVKVGAMAGEPVDIVRERLRRAGVQYMQDYGAREFDIDKASGNISCTGLMGEALENAGLAIVAISEELPTNSSFYTQLENAAPVKTIFATASFSDSGDLAGDSAGPSRFLAMRFKDSKSERDDEVEITIFPQTDRDAFYSFVSFAEEIGLKVLPINVAE
ncbi:hypothetical protein HYN59_16350 [Flavobacterium album]|uniref:3-hydroxyacyl-CoA dehydrogenase NAD binding domain-containing protein n=1 Tax=Flavobacterium album TaxID=2175091 RepID=A0A2S1R218_9FLAO|nr:3-hydroxyacyl-CoA dehydrogenase NAD-binding domain-containing protein [Flavobacterium album]AWH86581.1 hypothetical protein HYN59_16350 [Flavobacterium album]